LRERSLLHGPLAKLNQRIATWVLHSPEVGCVDLSVAAITPELLIDRGHVQEQRQPTRQRFRQTVLVLVKQVEMVLEAQRNRLAPSYAP
jgi:hypothetical protein